MSDIRIDDLVASETRLSVWDQDRSNCIMMRPPHTMSLLLANGRERKRGPWYYEIEFTSREQWFKFVREVNRMNRLVKASKRDEHGFPVLGADHDD